MKKAMVLATVAMMSVGFAGSANAGLRDRLRHKLQGVTHKLQGATHKLQEAVSSHINLVNLLTNLLTSTKGQRILGKLDDAISKKFHLSPDQQQLIKNAFSTLIQTIQSKASHNNSDYDSDQNSDNEYL